METFETLITIFTPLLTALVSWGVIELNIYIKTRTAKIKDDVARGIVSDILFEATGNIELAVNQTAQTFVDKVKGTENWNAETKAEAFNLALSTFKNLMGEAGMTALDHSVASSEAWIKAKIESTVRGWG